MTEEIINADGSRNWQANILLDNVKRLEQENKELLKARNHFMGVNLKYFNALEEIKVIADDTFKVCDDDCGNARKIKLIIDKINECIGE